MPSPTSRKKSIRDYELQNTPELWDYYRGRVDKPLSRFKYSKVLTALMNELVRSLIEDESIIELSKNLGSVKISRRKVNFDKPRLDYYATKVANEKIYHLNEHTGGYFYRYLWIKSEATFQNLQATSFTPCRAIKTTCR